MNNIMKHAFLLFATLLFSVLLASEPAQAGIATGGLFASYSTTVNWQPDRFQFESIRIDNIDFPDFDNYLLTQSDLGVTTNVAVVWKGYILVEHDGVHRFRFDVLAPGGPGSGMNLSVLMINQGADLFTGVYADAVRDIDLDPGWHRFFLQVKVKHVTDSQLQVYWTQPGQPEEIIPKDKLGYYFWSGEKEVIPESGAKEQFNYVAAGTGIEYYDSSNNLRKSIEPEIKIDVPAPTGDPNVDWMKDEVIVLWFSDHNDPKTMQVSNMKIPGSETTITGVGASPLYEGSYKYSMAWARIPAPLIDGDGSNELHLKFKKIGGVNEYFSDGIALIVPYEDASQPLGNLVLYMTNATVHNAASPTLTFPVDGSELPGNRFDALFIYNNGETKKNLTIGDYDDLYRPNYTYAHWGDGSEPAIDTVLKNLTGPYVKKIMPQDDALLELGNTRSWYPMFGRESRQLDVLSPKYVPNKWNVIQDQYVGGNQQEGLIDQITVDNDTKWIAFQHVGSNFDEDLVNGSAESGPLAVVGLYTTEYQENELEVIINGNGSVNVDDGGPVANCASGSCLYYYSDLTFVTLTAVPNGAATFNAWGGDCSGQTGNVCMLVIDRDHSVTASFSPIAPPPAAKCGQACDEAHCYAPTDNLCTHPSAPVGGVSLNALGTGWEWICEHPDAAAVPKTTTCQTERKCGWVER